MGRGGGLIIPDRAGRSAGGGSDGGGPPKLVLPGDSDFSLREDEKRPDSNSSKELANLQRLAQDQLAVSRQQTSLLQQMIAAQRQSDKQTESVQKDAATKITQAVNIGLQKVETALKDKAPETPGTPAPSSQVRSPTDQGKTPTTQPTRSPTDGGASSIMKGLGALFDTLKNTLREFGTNIESRRKTVSVDDYTIGQMSRRSLDYNTQSLQSYRQRIHDLSLGTGMDLKESIAYTQMANRYGTGVYRGGTTSTGGFGSFDQGEQVRSITMSAFGLGLDRGGLMSTLQQLGQAGAVGAAGVAGGQKQDYRQFAQTIAETLAAGKLFDRMDDVVRNIGSLASEISSRGGIVDPRALASAFADANLAARATGSARLQEAAPNILGDVSRLSATQMNDSMGFAMFLRTTGGSGPGGNVSLGDYMQYQDLMTGSDVAGQSKIMTERFKTFGGNVNDVVGNDLSAAQIFKNSQASGTALYAAASQMGMSPQKFLDMVRITAGVGSTQQGQANISALQQDAGYKQLVAGKKDQQSQLYAKAYFASGSELSSIIQEQQTKLERLSPAAILRSDTAEGKYYAELKKQQEQIAKGDSTGARTSFLQSLTTAPDKLNVQGENQLESFYVQVQELERAFEILASYVNQTSAMLQVNRTEATAYRVITNQTAAQYADPTLATERGRGGDWYWAAAVSNAGWSGKYLPNSATEKTNLTGGSFFPDAVKAAADNAKTRGAMKGVIAPGVVAGAGWLTSEFLDPALTAAGHDQAGAAAGILGDTATAAGLGFMVAGPWGAALAGTAGAGYSLYKNWNRLTGVKPPAPTTVPGMPPGFALPPGVDPAAFAGMFPPGSVPPTGPAAGSSAAAAGSGGTVRLGPGGTRGGGAEIVQGAAAFLPAAGGMVVAGGTSLIPSLLQAILGQMTASTDLLKLLAGGQGPGIPGERSTSARSMLPPAPTARSQTGVTVPGGTVPTTTIVLPGKIPVPGAENGPSAPSVPVSGGVTIPGAPTSPWDQAIVEAAKDAGIDPSLFRAIIDKESTANPNATNADSGARGLGQIMFDTARAADPNASWDDMYDPIKNIQMMAKVFKMKQREGGGKLTQDQLIMRYRGSTSSSVNQQYLTDVKKRSENFTNLNQATAASSKASSQGGMAERFIPIVNNKGEIVKLGEDATTTDDFMQAYQIAGDKGWMRNLGIDYVLQGQETEGAGVVAPEEGEIISIQRYVNDTTGTKEVAEDARGIDSAGDTFTADSATGLGSRAYGNSVLLRGKSGALHRLSHFSGIVSGLKAGQMVEAGTMLGAIGHTGRTSGPHLDWEMKARDASGAYQLISSEAWRKGILEFRDEANIEGMSNARHVQDRPKGGQGGMGETVDGENNANHQLDITITLQQDETGKIVGTVQGQPTFVSAFNKADPHAGQLGTSVKVNNTAAMLMPTLARAH